MADMAGLQSHVMDLVARSGGLHPPFEVIKSWPHPNHVDPEERGWEAPIALAIVMGITFIVYVARLWARVVISKSAGLDGIAMLPLIGLTISAVLAIRQYGFQWHVWDQTERTMITSREITLAIELNYLVSTTFIKVSILCFYRRITGSLTNIFVYSTWGSIIFCSVYGILFCFLIIFTCTPVVGFFHVYDTVWRASNALSCHDEGAIIVACAAISTIQDLVICMLPIFLIWNLKITQRQRFALCGIFGMGLITTICGILRTYYATYVYYYSYDITWYAYYGWVWTVLEAQLGVICASAPALKVFFQRYFKMPSSRAGYTATGSRNTPIVPSSRSRGYPLSNNLASQHSMTRSKIEGGGALDSDVPLSGIKVSQGLDVHVEERDDASQKSYASTRNLTSGYEDRGWGGKEGWMDGCRTVCAALKPGSMDESRNRSRERDVEQGVHAL
ncbi:hypothetical protein T440DRAFT_519420 [Plenodomus tracheiphilus IPT5]|uniref:Rhodopsin domain-containing protein n=1 Tax=Plenodomus tracheiphilus IPT5 TaxID=1408161 RepID=A0A6A7B491_9PLEO|nr:hypothetical protein T440DRAFT_519420 [Plenodomus tracheiphilus IPT5]